MKEWQIVRLEIFDIFMLDHWTYLTGKVTELTTTIFDMITKTGYRSASTFGDALGRYLGELSA